MKIAILLRRLHPPGGAEKSALYLKEELDNKHSVQLFGLTKSGEPDTTSTDAVTQVDPKFNSNLPNYLYTALFGEFRTASSLKSEVRLFNPDYIIAQHELSFLAAWIGRQNNIPYTIFLHDESLLPRRSNNYSHIVESILAVRSKLYSKIISKTLERADHVIANSDFISHIYKEEYNLSNIHTIYPFVDTDAHYVNNTGEKILHVNPSRHKGIETTLDVARLLNDEEFIITGPEPKKEIQNEINQLQNVSYIGYVDSMRDVYKETKLVIYPSKWSEPFGRIPIEAGISGIPTICSGTGGLREAVGTEDLIVEDRHPSSYVEKIGLVLNNYEYYSDISKENAKKLSGKEQINKFLDIINA